MDKMEAMTHDPPMSSEDRDEAWVEMRTRRQQVTEAVLLNLTNIAWMADNALLPAVFHELSTHFNVTSSQLSQLVLLRGISESLFAFPSGFFAEVLPRPRLICIGSLLWALGLAGCARAESWTEIMLSRLLNGIGLGIVQPLLFSLVADTNRPSRRGIAFGTLQFTGNLGATAGQLLATNLAPLMIAHMIGWRFTFLVIAVFSAVVGLGVMLFVNEPRNMAEANNGNKASIWSVFVDNMPKVGQLFRVPTFLIIIGQGAPGTIPWFAFSFLTMWLELGCFTNAEASEIVMMFGFGQAAAGLFGGLLLDAVSSRFPNHGPPSLAMLSVGLGFPMLALIFYGLPGGEGVGAEELALYSMVFFCFGTLISWCGIINQKVFADIVPQAIFAYVYSVDRAIEGTIGAAGSPAVGWLTDKVFHYNQEAAQNGDCDPASATALGNGIFTVCTSAWAICFVLFIGMHFTYPKDRLANSQEAVVPQKGDGKVCQAASEGNMDSDVDGAVEFDES